MVVKSPKADSMSNITHDFIRWFSEALDEEVVIEKLKGVLEGSVEEIQNRMDDMELQNEDRDEHTKLLQMSIDGLEQAERGRNLILTCLDCDVSIPAVANKLNELLGTKLKDEHLHYVTRLTSEGPKKIKVVFYSKAKWDLVFR